MRKTLATIALATIALTGCNTGPGLPDVGITGHTITGDGGWHVESQTVDYGTHTVTRYPATGVVVSATTLDR